MERLPAGFKFYSFVNHNGELEANSLGIKQAC